MDDIHAMVISTVASPEFLMGVSVIFFMIIAYIVVSHVLCVKYWRKEVIQHLISAGVKESSAIRIIRRHFPWYDIDTRLEPKNAATGLFGMMVLLHKWKCEDFVSGILPSLDCVISKRSV